MVRSDAEVVSQLPVFAAKRSKDWPDWVIVTCPYDDCGEDFLVVSKTWRQKLIRESRGTGKQFTIVGRPCPYCFRTARLPARVAP